MTFSAVRGSISNLLEWSKTVMIIVVTVGCAVIASTVMLAIAVLIGVGTSKGVYKIINGDNQNGRYDSCLDINDSVPSD